MLLDFLAVESGLVSEVVAEETPLLVAEMQISEVVAAADF
jgi:hypothetical protein